MFKATLVLLLSAAGSALAQTASNLPIVNTPTALITCQPAAITFSGGNAPYYLSVLPGGETGAVALEAFPTQTAAGSYVWTVNLQAGLSVTIAIRDGSGQLNYAQAVTIQAGPDTSCVGGALAGGSTSAGISSVNTSAISSAATSRASASSTAAAASSTSSAAAASSSQTSSAAAASSSATSSSAAATASGTTSSAAATTSKPAGAAQLASGSVFALGAAAVVALLV